MPAGIDEAGRGCVIGPLVIAIAKADEGIEGRLHELGVRDSKLLTSSARKKLAGSIRSLCSLAVAKVDARELNELMRKKISLNEIEAMKMAQLIDELGAEHVIVDSPDRNGKNFEKRVRRYLKTDCTLICENKADANHAIVGAASIIAKVERDREIEKIKRRLGVDFGSGYTSDEETISFLRSNLSSREFMKFVRVRWETLNRVRQRKLAEF